MKVHFPTLRQQKTIFLIALLGCVCLFVVCFLRSEREHSSGFFPARVYCNVMTSEDNMPEKALSVQKTWGKRCDKLTFTSDSSTAFWNNKLSILRMGNSGRKGLWSKTRESIMYFHEHHLDDFEWFLKSDDDSYIVMENMRHFLSRYDPDESWYFGKRFRTYLEKGYNSGGAGYVLSRGAVRTVSKVLHNADNTTDGDFYPCSSNNYSRSEDVQLGRCLAKVGIFPAHTLDELGRELFHPFKPGQEMESKLMPSWYNRFSYERQKPGRDCCSQYSVSFHYLTPRELFMFEFALYHMVVLAPPEKTFEQLFVTQIGQDIGSNQTS